MKSYPTIDTEIRAVPIVAFDKLDGSNIRAEWTKKGGFEMFGTRKRLLSEGDPSFGKARGLILEKYGDALIDVFRERRWQQAVAFFEYHGPRSFAGVHHEDDEHTVTLFDVAADKRGLLEPRPFLELFGHLDVPLVLYEGESNGKFVEEVRSGRLAGMTFEGVICKGPLVSPGRPLMFKIKNRAWIELLAHRCDGDEALFRELA